MTQVNFYTLASDAAQDRLQFVCRLTEKAFSLGHRVHIYTDSEQQAKLLDDLLWQFMPTSFIPHRLSEADQDCEEPVSIGSHLAPSHGDVLINLGSKPCQLEDRFSRINEVISSDHDSLEQGRTRYRFYKDKAYPIETFKL